MNSKKIYLYFLTFFILSGLKAQELIPIKIGKNYGYSDKEMKIIIETDYIETNPFTPQGLAIVKNKNMMYVIINKKGMVLPGFPEQSNKMNIKQITDDVIVMDNGLYLLKEFRYLDCNTIFIGEFNGGYARYKSKEDGKTGLINTKGEKQFHGKYDFIGDYSEGMCVVQKKDKYGFIDINGKNIIKTSFINYPGNFSNGRASLEENNKLGYIDKTGNFVIPPKYDDVNEAIKTFHDGMVVVKKEGLMGVIDTNGNIILPIEYQTVYYKGEMIFEVNQNGSTWLVNTSGQRIGPENLEDFGNAFSEGFIRVEKNNKASFMDVKGNFLMPFVLNIRKDFQNGYAECSLNTAYLKDDVEVCFIDKKGKVYHPKGKSFETMPQTNRNLLAQMEEIVAFNSFWITRNHGLINVYDFNGDLFLPDSYIKVITFEQYLVLTDHQNKRLFFNASMTKPDTFNQKRLMLIFTKLDQLDWYKLWNDSTLNSQKTDYLQLGKYKWALNDLNVTTFRNGDSILQCKNTKEFNQATERNLPALLTSVSLGLNGKQTTWYNKPAISDKRGLIPKGYMIASYEEWNDLLEYSGGDSIAGEFLFNMGFTNYGTISESGRHNDLIYAWLCGEAKNPDFIPMIAAAPVLGNKINPASGTTPGSGIPIRCVRKEIP
ncbi:MAG TPA: WG repeat-containing protein [Bacteroidales bacterium]|nr:WG repeat-containing protein [Bacteroidales bacterium]HPS71755.1 WG repeat-containing protein [Bacteroidales bacterium]